MTSTAARPTSARYRAACIPFATGCRQCGAAIEDRCAYCSATCRRTFERDHFWNTARAHALWLARGGVVLADGAHGYPGNDYGALLVRPRCLRCRELCSGEVNHVVPLNGARPSFGCCHHQSNLEVLCHDCHLDVTAAQRRAGLIGSPRPQVATLPFEQELPAMLKSLLAAAVLCVCVACTGPSPSPVAPSPTAPVPVGTPVVLHGGPPFALTLAPNGTPVVVGGAAWQTFVTITMAVDQVSPPRPSRVVVDCGDGSAPVSIAGFSGSSLIECVFARAGSYRVVVSAIGVAFTAVDATTAVALDAPAPPPSPVVPAPRAWVFTVAGSLANRTSTAATWEFDTNGDASTSDYSWDFGDGTAETSQSRVAVHTFIRQGGYHVHVTAVRSGADVSATRDVAVVFAGAGAP